jgi:hypothetical protein
VTDPWDAPDVLERHAHERDFTDRWRAFLRACVLLLLPSLPPEAREWVFAADEFERGQLTADGLTEVRARAWQFHDAHTCSSSLAELSGLRVAMHRLWLPGKPDRWHESASLFLHFCDEAGLREEQWWPLLQEQFPSILGRVSPA